MLDQARQLAKDISQRSIIRIKVGAVIFDSKSIYSWGWNNPGFDGLGEHAEAMALRRLGENKPDLSIVVYSTRRKKPITSKPCINCQAYLKGRSINNIYFMEKEDPGNTQRIWKHMNLDP